MEVRIEKESIRREAIREGDGGIRRSEDESAHPSHHTRKGEGGRGRCVLRIGWAPPGRVRSEGGIRSAVLLARTEGIRHDREGDVV